MIAYWINLGITHHFFPFLSFFLRWCFIRLGGWNSRLNLKVIRESLIILKKKKVLASGETKLGTKSKNHEWIKDYTERKEKRNAWHVWKESRALRRCVWLLPTFNVNLPWCHWNCHDKAFLSRWHDFIDQFFFSSMSFSFLSSP